MNLMARNPFYLNKGIGIFKNIEQPGYSIKILGHGVSGVVAGECDNGFNLIYVNNYDKQELVLSVLAKLSFERYKANYIKYDYKLLTSRYKITKTLDMID